MGPRRDEGQEPEAGRVRRFSYTCRIQANNGAIVTMLVGGSTAAAALTNVRRSRRGDWLRIEVGTGEGDDFRVLAECER